MKDRVIRITKRIVVVFFGILLLGWVCFHISTSKIVDYAGIVEEIRFDASRQCAFVKVRQALNGTIYEIEVPYSWKCKKRNGDKILITDVKEGYSISVNFKKDSVFKDGIHYVKPRGPIRFY